MAFVKSVMTHPKLARMTAEDGLTDFEPPQHESILYLTPIVDVPIGVFMVFPTTSVCFEVHTNILPEYWGPMALVAAKSLITWVFSNTECQKLVTRVPAFNRLAYKLAVRAGMRPEGVNTKSFRKHGTLFDQHMLGIQKG